MKNKTYELVLNEGGQKFMRNTLSELGGVEGAEIACNYKEEDGRNIIVRLFETKEENMTFDINEGKSSFILDFVSKAGAKHAMEWKKENPGGFDPVDFMIRIARKHEEMGWFKDHKELGDAIMESSDQIEKLSKVKDALESLKDSVPENCECPECSIDEHAKDSAEEIKSGLLNAAEEQESRTDKMLNESVNDMVYTTFDKFFIGFCAIVAVVVLVVDISLWIAVAHFALVLVALYSAKSLVITIAQYEARKSELRGARRDRMILDTVELLGKKVELMDHATGETFAKVSEDMERTTKIARAAQSYTDKKFSKLEKPVKKAKKTVKKVAKKVAKKVTAKKKK